MAEDFENYDAAVARAHGVVQQWEREGEGPGHQPPDEANKDRLDDVAAWGIQARPDHRWQAALALVVAIVLYETLPGKLIYGPEITRLALPVLEGILLVPLLVTAPHRHGDEPMWQRWASLLLIALINLANLGTLVLLVDHLIHGTKASGFGLITSAAAIWFTTVIVFGLWYYELDRGGPSARCRKTHREPDFLFPQMVTPEAAPRDWYPRFADYLYVSFTNATAFSPTDTMPLTHWAKMLMLVQSFASLVTVALVAARAVNILS